MTATPKAPPRDRAYDAHQAATEHIARLEKFEDEQEESGDYSQDGPASAGPYCSCDTCEIRETLAAAWPHALAHAADLVVERLPFGPDSGVVKLLREEARKSTLDGLDVPA